MCFEAWLALIDCCCLFGFVSRLVNGRSSGLFYDAPEARQTRIADARRRRLDEHGFPRITEDQNVDIIKAFIGSVNEDAVCALASRFNDGVPCRVVNKSHGSFNLCFFVEFDKQEGDEQPKKWVVRLPMGPAVENPWDKVISEVTTIRYIRKKTSIRVPRIHAYGRDSNLIRKENKDKGANNNSNDGSRIVEGQVFLITDFIAGANLDRKLLTTADQEHRRGFYAQLIGILAELRKLEFSKIGSLRPGKTDVSPILGPMISMSDNTLRLCPPPILTSATDYMKYEFDVVSEFFFAPVSNLKIDDLQKELYAFHALEPHFPGLINPSLDRGPFVLSHPDFRAHNIIVDEQLRIQGVIDWEFTSTVPLQLFTPPSWVTGCDSKETSEGPHAEFREVLHAQAKENPSYRQLEIEWYGEANEAVATPVSSGTVKTFCIAHILRKPCDAVEIFYDFLDNDEACATDEEKEARLAQFFKAHPELQAQAQRRYEESQAYSKYLADNGLFETRMDRICHMEKEMKARFGWK
ncbi:phosphotransferase enzyme family protein [Niveomyces insectorum RCEF 264]|uniref:Phosphotransferase enzyme family protein n=1 Tax=Niveomyces insectorum RCEF 264 TaxID=1081102 RepID=A0A167LSD0_9HYPO|nr:phosphotransferase enzyme family protein [Niveomyces insectorum RCEF 264]